jgi:hypothetical protein
MRSLLLRLAPVQRACDMDAPEPDLPKRELPVLDLRIQGKFRRGPAVTFKFDGKIIDAYQGESVVVALLASGIVTTRQSPKGFTRGPLCLMGSCQECAILVSGRKILACQTKVAQGLEATSECLST